jgi:hypothetical protein
MRTKRNEVVNTVNITERIGTRILRSKAFTVYGTTLEELYDYLKKQVEKK